jgi:hypothetical protein
MFLIGNKHLAFELELHIERTSQFSLVLGVNNNLGTEVEKHDKVAVGVDGNRGGVDLAESLNHKGVRGVKHYIDGSVFTILLLELGDGHANSGGGEELADDHKTWINSQKLSQTVSSVEL